jgi:hypothetical protein
MTFDLRMSGPMDILDEPHCPIPLEKMALLLGRDESSLDSMIDRMPNDTRAQLAVYCFGRCHTREAGFRIARRCEKQDLTRVAGLVGAALFAQSREPVAPAVAHWNPKPKVTLARPLDQDRAH